MDVKLGDKVKDRLTTLDGICVGITDYINGCRQICIQPQGHKDGKILDGGWFDVDRIEVVEAGAFQPRIARPLGPPARSGGPSTYPPPPRA